MTQRVAVRELGAGGVQQYLKDRATAAGGMVEHFTSPGKKGPPDLLIHWPEYAWARTHFIETKTIGGILKPWQERDHKQRRKIGLKVFVIWTKTEADRYVERYRPLV